MARVLPLAEAMQELAVPELLVEPREKEWPAALELQGAPVAVVELQEQGRTNSRRTVRRTPRREGGRWVPARASATVPRGGAVQQDSPMDGWGPSAVSGNAVGRDLELRFDLRAHRVKYRLGTTAVFQHSHREPPCAGPDKQSIAGDHRLKHEILGQ